MFKVGEYKIIFYKEWHSIHHTKYDEFGGSLESNGRYNTICEIWIPDLDIPRFVGIAKLHPNDKVDKILGKKIALQKAMGVFRKGWDNSYWKPFQTKQTRTEIWKAFRSWVESWRIQSEKDKKINQERTIEVGQRSPSS